MINKIDVRAIVKLLRPKQWIKNVFVFAAAVFSGNFLSLETFRLNIIVFFLFCFMSSSVYILNDLVDAEKDRHHPEKKNRPIASGKVSKEQAIFLFCLILIADLFLSYTEVNIRLFAILLSYLIINIFYSFKLKNVVIIDVMIITLGFVLRVESGSVSTGIVVSPWLLLCTILISLFLGFNKRKNEIITLDKEKGAHRIILEEYTIDLLDKMLSIVTPSILITYSLYTFNSIQSRRMMYTIPFVLYGIFRYQYLMDKHNMGGKPEEFFIKDRPFLINFVLWVIAVILIVYHKGAI